jgi:hypothetical protein
LMPGVLSSSRKSWITPKGRSKPNKLALKEEFVRCHTTSAAQSKSASVKALRRISVHPQKIGDIPKGHVANSERLAAFPTPLIAFFNAFASDRPRWVRQDWLQISVIRRAGHNFSSILNDPPSVSIGTSDRHKQFTACTTRQWKCARYWRDLSGPIAVRIVQNSQSST